MLHLSSKTPELQHVSRSVSRRDFRFVPHTRTLRRRSSAKSSPLGHRNVSSSTVPIMCDPSSPSVSRNCNGGFVEHDEPEKRDFAEIVVVRHGETSWNAAKIIQGHLDAELNEVGKHQASVVADRLSREYKFTAIYSSDLKRAFETAQIISARCDIAEVNQDPGLRERNLGDLQGTTLQDAAKLKPQVYKDFLSRNPDQEIPGGGESINQLHRRCTSTLQKIARKHNGESVLVVTHGGLIRELYKRAVPGKSPRRTIANTAVNVICISNNGNKWSLRTWGDVKHLDDTGFMKESFGGDGNSDEIINKESAAIPKGEGKWLEQFFKKLRNWNFNLSFSCMKSMEWFNNVSFRDEDLVTILIALLKSILTIDP